MTLKNYIAVAVDYRLVIRDTLSFKMMFVGNFFLTIYSWFKAFIFMSIIRRCCMTTLKVQIILASCIQGAQMDSYSGAFKACINLLNLRLGRQVYGLVVTTGCVRLCCWKHSYRPVCKSGKH
ncbi:uncharacterized protein LOC133746317 [Rosa rugosa]|uniref:uncharacterized protein LOC133740090 n=1 Tax=Rosa rugosa TaxID=74645 RepID=UPI002B40D39C|nr:uncharacterized protein LOC133740090 [Rosa rugosa]XP_062030484.1 uncharacterized protein LOC133746317 [Rosa rugosa]